MSTVETSDEVLRTMEGGSVALDLDAGGVCSCDSLRWSLVVNGKGSGSGFLVAVSSGGRRSARGLALSL